MAPTQRPREFSDALRLGISRYISEHSMSDIDHLSGRWNTRFGQFIQDFGANRLAGQLRVKPSAIYQWVAGFTTPRAPLVLSLIVISRKSGKALEVSDIYSQREFGRERRLDRKRKRGSGC